jgi:hypothetical protein
MKAISYALLFLLLLTFVSAEVDTFGTFERGQDVRLKQVCENCTYVNITEVIYPNTSVAVEDKAMTGAGAMYYYTFNLTDDVGEYQVTTCGDLDGLYTCDSYRFFITKLGEAEGGDIFQVFIYVLFIVAVLGIFGTFILTIAKFATTSETIFGVLITWSFYILLMLVYFLSNYQATEFITEITSSMLTYTAFSNVLLPLFALIVTFFRKSTEKRKPMSVREMTGGFGRYG